RRARRGGRQEQDHLLHKSGSLSGHVEPFAAAQGRSSEPLAAITRSRERLAAVCEPDRCAISIVSAFRESTPRAGHVGSLTVPTGRLTALSPRRGRNIAVPAPFCPVPRS